MPLKALIFDFDGLVLDTETPEVISWGEIYQEFGLEFPVESWIKNVGGEGMVHFNPIDYLQSNTGKPLGIAAIIGQWKRRSAELIAENDVLPGVKELLAEAEEMGLRVGIASSSPYQWVDSHLRRLKMRGAFESITNSNDVSEVKPSPELFNLALKRLDAQPAEAIVFEDSPNGVTAANKAGIFSVACPNPVTDRMPLKHADLRVNSLLDITISELLRYF